MTRFERWFIKRIMAREVVQGFDHAKNIEALYFMIRLACVEEFIEDDIQTLDAFLRERFEITQQKNVH